MITSIKLYFFNQGISKLGGVNNVLLDSKPFDIWSFIKMSVENGLNAVYSFSVDALLTELLIYFPLFINWISCIMPK